MKMKSAGLAAGAALDYMVSKASNPPGQCGLGWWERDEEGFLFDPLNERRYSPSTDYIDLEDILSNLIRRGLRIRCRTCRYATDEPEVQVDVNGHYTACGPDILTAVCRSYVISRLGAEVDVPDEFLAHQDKNLARSRFTMWQEGP